MNKNGFEKKYNVSLAFNSKSKIHNDQHSTLLFFKKKFKKNFNLTNVSHFNPKKISNQKLFKS